MSCFSPWILSRAGPLLSSPCGRASLCAHARVRLPDGRLPAFRWVFGPASLSPHKPSAARDAQQRRRRPRVQSKPGCPAAGPSGGLWSGCGHGLGFSVGLGRQQGPLSVHAAAPISEPATDGGGLRTMERGSLHVLAALFTHLCNNCLLSIYYVLGTETNMGYSRKIKTVNNLFV